MEFHERLKSVRSMLLQADDKLLGGLVREAVFDGVEYHGEAGALRESFIDFLAYFVVGGTRIALEEAVHKAGGFLVLAERIGVSSSAPSMWKARGRVPAEHCPAIERETGVRCERLRPDVAWDVLRLQAEPAASGVAAQAAGQGV